LTFTPLNPSLPPTISDTLSLTPSVKLKDDSSIIKCEALCNGNDDEFFNAIKAYSNKNKGCITHIKENVRTYLNQKHMYLNINQDCLAIIQKALSFNPSRFIIPTTVFNSNKCVFITTNIINFPLDQIIVKTDLYCYKRLDDRTIVAVLDCDTDAVENYLQPTADILSKFSIQYMQRSVVNKKTAPFQSLFHQQTNTLLLLNGDSTTRGTLHSTSGAMIITGLGIAF
jgi:hypothetical protein